MVTLIRHGVGRHRVNAVNQDGLAIVGGHDELRGNVECKGRKRQQTGSEAGYP